MQNGDTIRRLAEEYREMNGTHVEVLSKPPSAIEFARLVHISRPVLIQRIELPAHRLWTDNYLIEKLGSQPLSVAITPDGCVCLIQNPKTFAADAIHKGPDELDYFVEPLVEELTIQELLNQINSNGRAGVYYLQSQNGNIFSSGDREDGPQISEFERLRSDIVSEIDWCSEALGREPEAVNIWIGNGKSVTSIHSDPYENIYSVIRGEKRFTLIPPTDGWSLQERFYPHAQFTRSSSDGSLQITPSEGTPLVRWSSLPDRGLLESLPANVRPIQVTVKPGQALYLPVGWWHHVEQSDETTIALNWWYDAESQGLQWAVLRTLREVEHVPKANDIENK